MEIICKLAEGHQSPWINEPEPEECQRFSTVMLISMKIVEMISGELIQSLILAGEWRQQIVTMDYRNERAVINQHESSVTDWLITPPYFSLFWELYKC